MVALILTLSACQSTRQFEPLLTAQDVDLERFAGQWYVIANIPTFLETQAFNSIEYYAIPEQGKVATTFTFNKGAFDGPRRTYRPTGFVETDRSNAIWGMQFVWPFKAEYRIVYVDDAYRTTIVGRSKRDYLWVMSREPIIPQASLDALLDIAEAQGYERDAIRLVPQQPLAERARLDIEADGNRQITVTTAAAPTAK
ncbi:MAG: lipocalin family protein [Pseudomonadota bacterium]